MQDVWEATKKSFFLVDQSLKGGPGNYEKRTFFEAKKNIKKRGPLSTRRGGEASLTKLQFM